MTNNQYDRLVRKIEDNASSILYADARLCEDPDEFHRVLFGAVLDDVNNDYMNSDLNALEAVEISEVCSEREGLILREFEQTQRDVPNDEARVADEIDRYYERGICAPDW
jgi:hypothetical protein